MGLDAPSYNLLCLGLTLFDGAFKKGNDQPCHWNSADLSEYKKVCKYLDERDGWGTPLSALKKAKEKRDYSAPGFIYQLALASGIDEPHAIELRKYAEVAHIIGPVYTKGTFPIFKSASEASDHFLPLLYNVCFFGGTVERETLDMSRFVSPSYDESTGTVALSYLGSPAKLTLKKESDRIKCNFSFGKDKQIIVFDTAGGDGEREKYQQARVGFILGRYAHKTPHEKKVLDEFCRPLLKNFIPSEVEDKAGIKRGLSVGEEDYQAIKGYVEECTESIIYNGVFGFLENDLKAFLGTLKGGDDAEKRTQVLKRYHIYTTKRGVLNKEEEPFALALKVKSMAPLAGQSLKQSLDALFNSGEPKLFVDYLKGNVGYFTIIKKMIADDYKLDSTLIEAPIRKAMVDYAWSFWFQNGAASRKIIEDHFFADQLGKIYLPDSDKYTGILKTIQEIFNITKNKSDDHVTPFPFLKKTLDSLSFLLGKQHDESDFSRVYNAYALSFRWPFPLQEVIDSIMQNISWTMLGSSRYYRSIDENLLSPLRNLSKTANYSGTNIDPMMNIASGINPFLFDTMIYQEGECAKELKAIRELIPLYNNLRSIQAHISSSSAAETPETGIRRIRDVVSSATRNPLLVEPFKTYLLYHAYNLSLDLLGSIGGPLKQDILSLVQGSVGSLNQTVGSPTGQSYHKLLDERSFKLREITSIPVSKSIDHNSLKEEVSLKLKEDLELKGVEGYALFLADLAGCGSAADLLTVVREFVGELPNTLTSHVKRVLVPVFMAHGAAYLD